tara:strand:- start:874 stop:1188 length:315 start_codon:yes stop_codon:yes gene_type:complete
MKSVGDSITVHFNRNNLFILDSKPESSSFLMAMFGWLYNSAMVYVGLIIGSSIALLFILFDVFYITKRLNNSVNSSTIRFLVMSGIAIIVGAIYYIVENVIDII